MANRAGSRAGTDPRTISKAKAPRVLGVLFEDVSIDRAAYLTVRAASCWGGQATLAIDADNRAVCYCPGTRDELALWKTSMEDIVGVFTGAWDGRVSSRKRSQGEIGDAIVSHLEGRMGARRAA